MTTQLRHRCRRCRSKLPAPVENHHHAFCTRGCHSSFYRARCVVCECSIRRKNERQRVCFGAKCKSQWRGFPRAYSWPESALSDENRVTLAKVSEAPLETPILRAPKQPSELERPRHHCLRMWSWGGDGVADHSLYDAHGLTIARVVLDGDCYVLRCPNAWPRQSWPDLERAKRGAESFALMNLPLDPVTAARVARENSKPHPLGAPLNRQMEPCEPAATAAAAAAPDSDWEIPAFLDRRPTK
jgi:hypothetical protein